MKQSVESSYRPTVEAGPSRPASADAGDHLGRVVAANAELANRLLRCLQQRDLILAATQRIATLGEPGEVENAILSDYGTILRAGAVYMDRAGCCTRAPGDALAARSLDLPPGRIRAALADEVEAVRQSLQSRRIADVASLDGARVLLTALPRADSETGVVIAVRRGPEPPFDSSDVAASESVLGYGTQIMSNAVMVGHLRQAALETVCALVNAIDAKDNYTSDHSERVGILARLTGLALGLDRERVQALEWAGLLHDVGKIGVAEQILNKPGELTASELKLMRDHPRIGHDMLKPVARFEPVLAAVLYHHENYDGSGYPAGLRGDEIPLDARIVHVVDVFDALTTTRPYRSQYGLVPALKLLEKGTGRITDPDVTRAFVEALRRYQIDDPHDFRAHFPHLLTDPTTVPADSSEVAPCDIATRSHYSN